MGARDYRRWWHILVGRPILRLKGHYLAVATLGFRASCLPSSSPTKPASPVAPTALTGADMLNSFLGWLRRAAH